MNAFFMLEEKEAIIYSTLFFFYFALVIFFLRTDIIDFHISINLLISYLTITTIAYIFATNNRLLHIKEKILIHKLEKLSSTDQLTHLYNRVKLKDLMQHEIDFSKRYSIPLCVALIDIDHFKYVNDTYGHQAGDEVLQKFAKFLVRNSRKADIIARWGGEEFLIILPKTSLKEAVLFGNKLNKAMRKYPFGYRFSNTCSIGIAECNPNDTTESLIERADKALYLAKNNGRDQTKDQNDLRNP
ncbi:MAG: GGDEF domain-containing protein [Epsilonproteobacteria bacterium]|nr:GGDEF domain-containing protein [Campylobacterota bacterium]